MTRDEQSTDPEGTTEPQDAPVDRAPAEPVVNLAEEQAARLRVQLDEQSARLRTVSKAYKDLQQEMDAFRRRQQAMADAKAERKAARVVERFFDPVQNLKRSLEADGDAQSLREGVALVLTQFSQRMEELGLREVPGLGSKFDPKVHDALAVMPVPDESQDGVIMAVHSTGWMVGDTVVQPAQVVIGKFEAPVAEA